jgi:hypothetical protein
VATVTVVDADRTLEIEATSIVSGLVNDEGHLILTRHDGTELDMGAVSGMQLDNGTAYSKVDAFTYVGDTDPGTVPDGSVWLDTTDVAGPFASSTQKGLVELATNDETLSGTDNTRAVTPASLASVPGNKVQILAPNANTEAAAPSAYPNGISQTNITTDSGYSVGAGFGTLTTYKIESDRCYQTFVGTDGGTRSSRMWMRTHHSTLGGGGWTAWQQVQLMYTLTPGAIVQTTSLSAYPNGVSRMYFTTANGSGWDFAGTAGELETFVDGTDFARQTFSQHSGGSGGKPVKWHRTATSAGNWTPWQKPVLEEDTGWVTMTLLSGFTSGTAQPLQYRVKRGIIYFRGGAAGTFTEGTYTDVTAAGAIPAAYRPSQVFRGGAVGTGMRPCGFELHTDGTVRLGWQALNTAPTWIALATSYPL